VTIAVLLPAESYARVNDAICDAVNLAALKEEVGLRE